MNAAGSILPSGLPEWIDDEEALARFVCSSSQYNTLGPKPAAFLPSKDPVETSVSRHDGNPLDELWRLGHASAGERSLKGAAFLKAMHVRHARLMVESSEPPDRHAAIRGWPVNPADPRSEKAQRKERAVLLCENASFVNYD